MQSDTTKRLANLNGKAIKKTISVTKTLAAGDDKATTELVRQLGGVVNEMTAVLNRWGEIGTSLPQPVNCEGVPVAMKNTTPVLIPVQAIREQIEQCLPKQYDVHKVVRNNGTMTVYFETTDRELATESDISSCEDIVKDSGMKYTNGRLVDGGAEVAVELCLTEPNGNPVFAGYVPDKDEQADDVGVTESAPIGTCEIPTREKMLEVMTAVVARAVDVVNRHTEDQDPSVRKLESAIGFKHDLKFLIRNRFELGTREYAQAKNLYGVIKTLEDMLESGKYAAIEPVAAYFA